jgi:hypothetical protein
MIGMEIKWSFPETLWSLKIPASEDFRSLDFSRAAKGLIPAKRLLMMDSSARKTGSMRWSCLFSALSVEAAILMAVALGSTAGEEPLIAFTVVVELIPSVALTSVESIPMRDLTLEEAASIAPVMCSLIARAKDLLPPSMFFEDTRVSVDLCSLGESTNSMSSAESRSSDLFSRWSS